MAKKLTVRLHDKDNVVVVRTATPEGTFIPEENVTTVMEIPMGHKVAVTDIKQGDPIVKYGFVIGTASQDIKAGEQVHNHNLHWDNAEVDYRMCEDYVPTEMVPEDQRPTFNGYIRPDGRVGTRNYIGVFTTVNCCSSIAKSICDYFTEDVLKDYPDVDGVIPYNCPLGCGMESYGKPMDLLRQTIGNYIKHQNTGAALLIGLGCERNNIDALITSEGLKEGERFRRMVIQEEGGSRKAIAKGIAIVKEFLETCNQDKRQPASIGNLTVALQCGGSDAFSGISANPALGNAMTKLIQNGGSCILAETTEVHGGDHTLTCRARTPEVGQRLVDDLQWWVDYSQGAATQMNGVIVPGNQKGGITSITEKALGNIKKGGDTAMVDVIEYACPVVHPGFNVMNTPAFDSISMTGEIAGGSNLCVFTTGRGSCIGTYPAPTTKLCSNTPAYENMIDDIDINCGSIIDGDKTLDEVGDEILAFLIEVANGRKPKSEIYGYGADEFNPWNYGKIC